MCGGHIGHVNYTVGTYFGYGGYKWDLVTVGPVGFEEMFEIVIL